MLTRGLIATLSGLVGCPKQHRRQEEGPWGGSAEHSHWDLQQAGSDPHTPQAVAGAAVVADSSAAVGAGADEVQAHR